MLRWHKATGPSVGHLQAPGARFAGTDFANESEPFLRRIFTTSQQCVVWAELLDESHADTTISALRPRVAAAVRSLTPCVLGHFISQGKHTAALNYVRYSFENHNSSAHASALEWLLQAAVAVSGPAEALALRSCLL